MTVEGAWTMNDDGSFELAEPFKTWLAETKMAATDGWREAAVSYLEDKCPYTKDEMNVELLRRVTTRETPAMEIFDEFIIEALTGDLFPAG